MKSQAISSVKIPALPVLITPNELQNLAFRLADDNSRALIECSCMIEELSGDESDQFIQAEDFTGTLEVSIQLSSEPQLSSPTYKYDLNHVDHLARSDVQEALDYLLGRQSNASSCPRPSFRTNLQDNWVWFTAL